MNLKKSIFIIIAVILLMSAEAYVLVNLPHEEIEITVIETVTEEVTVTGIITYTSTTHTSTTTLETITTTTSTLTTTTTGG